MYLAPNAVTSDLYVLTDLTLYGRLQYLIEERID